MELASKAPQLTEIPRVVADGERDLLLAEHLAPRPEVDNAILSWLHDGEDFPP
jgi:hypothetical protein